MSKKSTRKSSSKKATEAVASVEKTFKVADTKSNRDKMSALISKVAAKIKAEKKLTDFDLAVCLALKFRAVKQQSVDLYYEMINSKSNVQTHKSSTYVAKFNAACKSAAKKLRDIRNAVYSYTVAEYKKDSQFAKDVSIFDATYSISTDTHSSKLTHTMKSIKTADTFKKVAALKSLKSEVNTCVKAVS